MVVVVVVAVVGVKYSGGGENVFVTLASSCQAH